MSQRGPDLLPQPGIRTVRRIYSDVARRAMDGSPEDQRAVLEWYLGVSHRPEPKPTGLLSPAAWE